MSEPKLLHLLHVSHEGVYKAIDKHLKATYGLSSTQHGILFVLEKQGALTTTELSEILAINKSAVSALGDRLVEAGFALREANPNDRRSAFLALTDRGRDYAKA
ncbi:MAG: MarR family transcriptional regulator, partial [Pseudomonadota bacterium]